MKKTKFPPLKALRAFESAARHLSITEAANELFVTPGAISQQIKVLEEFLDITLFKRLHRQILLTDAGQCLLPGIQNGLEIMADSINSIHSLSLNRPITITTPPSFASKWLVPRLHRFRQRHPNIDVRIETSIDVIDIVHSDIDIAIRYGSGDYPGLSAELLMHQEVFPVCSPDLIKDDHPMKQPSDLKHYELLKFDDGFMDLDWPDWEMWLRAADAEDVDTQKGLAFNQHELLIQAAIEGHGVALVGSVAARDDLKKGLLIKPFELTFPLRFAYYFVTSPSKASWPGVNAVRDWIMAEEK